MTTKSHTILIADDEPHLLRLVKFRLERDGHTVIVAGDGETALAHIRRAHPDLCVLDVMMPRMGGFDVLRELRADDDLQDVRVIMLTARAQDADVEKGFDLGADDYISKPFSPQELRVRVAAQLEQRG